MAQIVSTESITDGMITAAPVINRYGQVLLPAGTELRSDHAVLFKTWGIPTITVASPDQNDASHVTDEMRNDAEMRVRRKMRWEISNSYEEALFEMAVAKIIRSGS